MATLLRCFSDVFEHLLRGPSFVRADVLPGVPLARVALVFITAESLLIRSGSHLLLVNIATSSCHPFSFADLVDSPRQSLGPSFLPLSTHLCQNLLPLRR